MKTKPVGAKRKSLTPELIVMIDAYLDGMSKYDSFVKAFPDKSATMSDDAIEKNAQRTFQSAVIQKEMERRKQIRDDVIREKAKTQVAETEFLSSMWTKKKHINELIGLITWSQNMRNYADSDNAKISAGKLEKETLETIGKIFGYDAPVKVEQDSTITVKFSNSEGNETKDSDDWTG